MEFFNYVMVLASVIVGLAVTQLLQGVGKLIQHPEREKLYWVHLLWVAVIFLNALVLWWWEFRLSSLQHWTFELYLFVIGFAVVLYLICVVLMPSDLGGYGSFRAYYYARRRWLFGLILLFGLMDFAELGGEGTRALSLVGMDLPELRRDAAIAAHRRDEKPQCQAAWRGRDHRRRAIAYDGLPQLPHDAVIPRRSFPR